MPKGQKLATSSSVIMKVRIQNPMACLIWTRGDLLLPSSAFDKVINELQSQKLKGSRNWNLEKETKTLGPTKWLFTKCKIDKFSKGRIQERGIVMWYSLWNKWVYIFIRVARWQRIQKDLVCKALNIFCKKLQGK